MILGQVSGSDLAQVALGREPADLVIDNARLVNVYTGEVLEDQSVAVKGTRIAYVGSDVEEGIGPKTEVIDARGQVLIPGFIDGHIHLDWFCTLDEFLRAAIPHGTTAACTEMSSVADGLGYEGILEYLAAMEDQPAKIYGLAPAISLLNSARYGGRAMITIDQMERVAGVGEVYWPRVLEQDEEAERLLAKARACGKAIEGHTAGARGRKLAASVAGGLSSCHESITASQTLERLRLGMYTMLREGSVRRDLTATATVANLALDCRRLVLVSDSLWPNDLVRHGHMDHVVQRAIDLGCDPVKAVQMATLNAAEYFGMDGDIGGIAPGRCADMQIVPELDTMRPRYVISDGRVVAKDGELLVEPRRSRYSAALRHTVRLPRPLRPADLAVAAPKGRREVAVRAIHLCGNVLTEERIVTLPVVDGMVLPDAARGVLKAAVLDRQHNSGERAVAFATGCGMRKGALATSITFDGCKIAAIGASDADLAGAINRLAELQGGLVLWADGGAVVELPLPVSGTMSERPIAELAARCDELLAACAELGAELANPLLSLITITFTGVPALRLRLGGLLDVRKGEIVSMFADA